jgi:hypothetical protein
MWKIFSVPCGSALYKFHCICICPCCEHCPWLAIELLQAVMLLSHVFELETWWHIFLFPSCKQAESTHFGSFSPPFGGGVEPSPLLLKPLLSYCTSPRWWWWWWWVWSSRLNDSSNDCQGKPKYLEETRLSSALSTTNPTWLDRARTQAAAMEGWQLIAWATARPLLSLSAGNIFQFLRSTIFNC